MPITALPSQTIRLLGSTQVLTTPLSVVKELVDNSIDAHATSIFVEISVNTLNTIQVRDNGHGIHPDDRAMVCRRYCTSKIREFDDLRGVGGKSLGFRGEALASVAECGGGLNIITRVEGEAVAIALGFARDGEAVVQERASHPIGTTVKVMDFFSGLPVRKQTALKDATKCLGRIKRLLQAYALARPNVRFSLKVLKAKNDKNNWMYAPKPGAGVEDAAFKVVGKDCASQCAWSVIESEGYEIHAYLPRPDADREKVSNLGQFISVDSRPVSVARGTLKEIVAMFKNQLSSASPQLETVRDPFLCMNIVCPSDSYDPNIEPAKDDVMFDNPEMVKAAVKKLLDVFYTVAQMEGSESSPHDNAVSASELGRQASDTVRVHEDIEGTEDNRDQAESSEPPAKRRRIFRSNMYGCDEDDLDLVGDQPLPEPDAEEDTAQSLHDVTISNPWTVAKMNAPVWSTAKIPITNTQLLTPLQERTGAELNTSPSSTPSDLFKQPAQMLPTPQTSSPARRSFHERRSEDDGLRVNTRHPLPWQNLHTSPVDELPDEEASLLTARQTPTRPARDFISARQLPLGTPLGTSLGTPLQSIPEAPSRTLCSAPRKHQHNVNKPFVPPVQDPSVVWFQSVPSPSQSQRPRVPPPRAHGLDIRDAFAAAAQRAGSSASPPRARPASTGPISDVGIEKTVPSVTGSEQQASAPQHSRRRVTDGGPDRLHRSKSARLPLERVPADSRMQNIVVGISRTTDYVVRSFMELDMAANLVKWQLAPAASYNTFAQPPREDELQNWCAKVNQFLHTLYPDKSMEGDLETETRTAFSKLQDVEPTSSLMTLSVEAN